MLGALLLLLTTADPEPQIRAGEQAYKSLDFRTAAGAFEKACAADACTRAQLLRVYTGLATALASLGQTAKAAEAFKRVLFIAPDWQLPQGASPRLREPFDAALVFWRSRAAAQVTVKPAALEQNQPASITAQLEADPLVLVDHLVLLVRRPDREEQLDPADRTPLADGGFAQRFDLPAALTAPGPITLIARAVSTSGSVLLETQLEREIVGEAKPALAPPQVENTPKPEGRALLHLWATAVFDVLSRQLGAEVLASVSPATILDLNLGATFGANIGLRLGATLHLPRTYRASPFVQARFGLHPTAGPAFGGGLALGGTVEAGPGRATASVAGELFRAAPQYAAFGVLVQVGYELDLPGLRAD